MRLPLLNALRLNQAVHGIAMQRFYDLEGISRQGYFQACFRQHIEQVMMEEISTQVLAYRRDKDRRAGSRSLYYNLDIKGQYSIGVSKFERLMRKYDLVLASLKTRLITTRSCARSGHYDNLCKELVISNINQLVVGDLTYIFFSRQTYYLFLLTDVYSARIVGWWLHKRMRAQEALMAFKGWAKLRGKPALRNCIHHTDGGSQYFSNLYLQAMQQHNLRISVAGDCLDNAFAEQRNGLIKNHLLPIVTCRYQKQLPKAMKDVLYFYNHERKQQALGWLSPVAFEQKYSVLEHRPKLQMYDRDTQKRSTRQWVF